MSSACGAVEAQPGSDSEAHCAVATWAQFERQAPEAAEVAARLWPGPLALHRNESLPEGASWFAISYLGTVRRDGARACIPSARFWPSGGCSRRSRGRRRKVGTSGEIPGG